LRHGALTQGPKVDEFENKVASYVGAKYAVAVSNGTAALHLACMALELGEGDEVITSPNTFVSTSNSILYVGAKPVFVDIDKRTLNIDINQIEKTILDSKNIKAIFPVHFGGLPCNMKRIMQLAEKYNLAIIEDAAHALGATYSNGFKVGNCQYSDMTILSFHPVKGIAAGEGGMITTNDKKFYNKLLLLRSHGITKGNFEFPGISSPDNSLINKDEALVGERGVQLSGGQRQRIGIARALYLNPDVFVFDEATSALDGITERIIMDSIQDFHGSKTIIMIAHRLKTVRECDQIFFLENGQITDQGSYSELLEKNTVFKKMAQHE